MKFDKIIYGAKVALPAANFGENWGAPVGGYMIGVKNNKIALIEPDANLEKIDFDERIFLNGGIITAGFIDTQVNGGGGVLFNDQPNEDTVLQILEGHKKFGTTHILPTLITDDLPKVRSAIAAVRQAIENGKSGIIGIHLEGPFLNPQKKGIHNQNKFLKLTPELVDEISALCIAPTLITLAPELQDKAMVRALDDKPWVLISMGHSNASAEDACKAVEDGVRGVTHLFNAMSGITARNPGVAGFALTNHSLYCGIIADLVHVDAMNLRLAFDCLGTQNLMLVTDAMSPVGSDITSFEFEGEEIFVRDGSCFNADGVLAGSALDMLSAVRNMHKIGIPIGQCLQMASETPARFLYLHEKIGSIRIGNEATLIHIDDELQTATII